MARVFLDSSAAVRRYFQPERGANRVREICSPSLGHTLLLARLATVEIPAALSRRMREGSMTRQGRDERLSAFRMDVEQQFRLLEADERVFAMAGQLVLRYPLRSLDALQLSCVLAVRAQGLDVLFWTADQQQAAAAQREGLDVELVA